MRKSSGYFTLYLSQTLSCIVSELINSNFFLFADSNILKLSLPTMFGDTTKEISSTRLLFSNTEFSVLPQSVLKILTLYSFGFGEKYIVECPPINYTIFNSLIYCNYLTNCNFWNKLSSTKSHQFL